MWVRRTGLRSSIDCDGVKLEETNPVYVEAEKLVQKARLDGRGLCHLGGECEKQFRKDQDVSVEKVIT